MEKKKEHNFTVLIIFIILGIGFEIALYQLYLKTDLAILISSSVSFIILCLLVIRYATWKEAVKRHEEELSLIKSLIKQNNEIIKFLKRLKIK